MTPYNINDDIADILLSAQEIDSIVTRLAADIDRDYPDPHKRLLLVCILKGSIVFMGDLMKKIKRPVEIDCMKVSSYNHTISSGELKIALDLKRTDLPFIDILLVEDIIDSGKTMACLTAKLKNERGATSVRCMSLLDKPSRREVDYTPDYLGTVIPDEFVVGYGLDYDEKYRALPYIGVLKPHIYENNTKSN